MNIRTGGVGRTNMRAWIIVNGPSVATEDTAYLIGRTALRFDELIVSRVELDATEAPDCPGDIDIIVNRVRGSTRPEFYNSLQALADSVGAPLTNPASAAIRSNDKRTYATDFAGMAPPTKLARNLEDLETALTAFDGDIIVKTPQGFGGKNVKRIQKPEDLCVGADLLAQTAYDEVVVQPFFSGFTEGDRRIVTVRGEAGEHKVIASLIRTPGPGEWKCNISSGGKGAIYEPNAEEIEFAQDVAEKSGLDFAQSDFGWHKGKLFLIETNQTGGGLVDFDFGNRANSGDEVAKMFLRLATRGR